MNDEIPFSKKYLIKKYNDYMDIAKDMTRLETYEYMSRKIVNVLENEKGEMSDVEILKFIGNYLYQIEETGFHCLD